MKYLCENCGKEMEYCTMNDTDDTYVEFLKHKDKCSIARSLWI